MDTKPGVETSEFKLVVLITALGALVDGAAMLVDTLRASGAVEPGTPWLSIAAFVTSSLLIGFKALGYTRSRTLVKLAALQPQASEALAKDIPFVTAVVKALREDAAAMVQVPMPPNQVNSGETRELAPLPQPK